MNTAVCLGGYGLLVAVAAPRALCMAMTGSAPRLGIVGWFVAVTTVLLSWVAALLNVMSSAPAAPLRAAAGLLLGALAVRMTWALLSGGLQARARRDRQRSGLALLGHHDRHLDVLVVESPAAMVYCLPGRPATVVVTTGARNALTWQQLDAVLAHERAHLTGRHSIALAAAYAAARTLPQPSLFRSAAEQISTLLEMRADDVAARAHGSGTVASALAAMSRSPAPAPALGAAGPAVLVRARRLSQPESATRLRHTRLALAAVVIALAAGPYLAAISPICPHHLW